MQLLIISLVLYSIYEYIKYMYATHTHIYTHILVKNGKLLLRPFSNVMYFSTHLYVVLKKFIRFKTLICIKKKYVSFFKRPSLIHRCVCVYIYIVSCCRLYFVISLLLLIFFYIIIIIYEYIILQSLLYGTL